MSDITQYTNTYDKMKLSFENIYKTKTAITMVPLADKVDMSEFSDNINDYFEYQNGLQQKSTIKEPISYERMEELDYFTFNDVEKTITLALKSRFEQFKPNHVYLIDTALRFEVMDSIILAFSTRPTKSFVIMPSLLDGLDRGRLHFIMYTLDTIDATDFENINFISRVTRTAKKAEFKKCQMLMTGKKDRDVYSNIKNLDVNIGELFELEYPKLYVTFPRKRALLMSNIVGFHGPMLKPSKEPRVYLYNDSSDQNRIFCAHSIFSKNKSDGSYSVSFKLVDKLAPHPEDHLNGWYGYIQMYRDGVRGVRKSTEIELAKPMREALRKSCLEELPVEDHKIFNQIFDRMGTSKFIRTKEDVYHNIKTQNTALYFSNSTTMEDKLNKAHKNIVTFHSYLNRLLETASMDDAVRKNEIRPLNTDALYAELEMIKEKNKIKRMQNGEEDNEPATKKQKTE